LARKFVYNYGHQEKAMTSCRVRKGLKVGEREFLPYIGEGFRIVSRVIRLGLGPPTATIAVAVIHTAVVAVHFRIVVHIH
jgi:hypothetical protein